MYVTANATFFLPTIADCVFCANSFETERGLKKCAKEARIKVSLGGGHICGFCITFAPRASYDFNYCLMSLFLLCLLGPRSSIFYFTLPPSYLRANTVAKVRRGSVTDMFGASAEMFEQRDYHPNWIECSYFEDLLRGLRILALFSLTLFEENITSESDTDFGVT